MTPEVLYHEVIYFSHLFKQTIILQKTLQWKKNASVY